MAIRADGIPRAHTSLRLHSLRILADIQVRIFKPTKNTMQSAKGKTKVWRIDWDVLQGSGRWENPLMGWASSADYMQGTTLAFRTREDACRFAERQGWEYYVQEPKAARIPPKSYGEFANPHFDFDSQALYHTHIHFPKPLLLRPTKLLQEPTLTVTAENYTHVPGKLRIHHTK